MSPRDNAELGFYLLPFIADIIGRCLKTDVVFPINHLGKKAKTASQINEYLEILRQLGINPINIWIDSDPVNLIFARETIEKAIEEKWIVTETRIVYQCECGKTNFLDEQENFQSGGFQRKVYEIKDGEAICMACQTIARATQRLCLLLNLPVEKISLKILPEYAAKEGRELLKFLQDKQLLISKNKLSGITVDTSKGQFQVDVDFFWMIFLASLKKYGFSVYTLLCGHKTIKHALLAFLMAQRIGVEVPKYIIAIPYLNIDFGNNKHLLANRLLEEQEQLAIRYFLATTLAAKSKEVVLQSRLLYWISHSIRVDLDKFITSDTESEINIENLIAHYNQQRFQSILANLRKNKISSLSNLDKKLVKIILSRGVIL